jgi:aminopeptidase N
MLSVIPLILVLFQSPVASPIPDPLLPNRGNPAVDVQHYELHLQLEPKRRFVEGRAVVGFQILQTMAKTSLDFHHMLEVTAVSLDQQKVDFTQTDEKLNFNLPFRPERNQKVELEVTYRGFLPQVEYDGEIIGMLHDGHHLVAYLEPDGAHNFFPCNDHPSDKATYDLYVSVPDGNLVGAIGELVSERAAATEGFREFHWRTQIPTSTYLVALAAGNYSLIKREEGKIAVWDYCEPRDEEDIKDSLASVPPMIPYFERFFGPYPFEKYGHVTTRHWIGGMEDQTLTVLGREEALSGDVGLLAHELGHQWFGNWVGPRQWTDLWLNEGWATFCELLWYEHDYPEQTSRTLKEWRRSTIRLAMRAHPHTLAKPDPKNLFNPNLVYNKGGMVISLLDGYLGRAGLVKATKAYLKEFGGKNAATADFERILSRESGIDMKPFFDAWVRQNDLPQISWQIETEKEGDGYRCSVTLKQVNGHFPMTAALDLLGKEPGQRLRLLAKFDKPEITLSGHANFLPTRSSFDPEQKLPWVPAEPTDSK